MTTKQHEHTLNVRLSDELNALGLNAKAELIRSGQPQRIDIEILSSTHPTIYIEAEHGQTTSKKREAIRDADRRIHLDPSRCVIAICYPDDTDEQTIKSAQLIWTVRDATTLKISHTRTPWTKGRVDQLAATIQRLPEQLGDPDLLAAQLSNQLENAVGMINDYQKQLLAAELDLPKSENKKPPYDNAAKRAFLVIAGATMFHARLAPHLPQSKPEIDQRTGRKFNGRWPPDHAQKCASATDPIPAFSDAWDTILALDYKPIFATARAAILAPPTNPQYLQAVKNVTQTAISIANQTAGLRHDLLGRIFHKILDTAKYNGSYYTSTAAATMLSQLAITEDFCDWNNTKEIAKLRITDPACGTGTLLMAAAERVRDLIPTNADQSETSRIMIEKVLTGYDVNLTATHMAATTLGLLSPTTHFREMKIARALRGVETGKAYVGSLEFLDRQAKIIPWPEPLFTQVETEKEMSKISPGAPAQAELAHLVIMNPPFTRDSLRHDDFPQKIERMLKDRERQLMKNAPVHLSSIANAFIVLADWINKSDKATLAAVLPLVTATNASSNNIRRFIAHKYHIETIVTSQDPQRMCFSENTNISEILIICRRQDNQKEPPPTRIVNLAVNPNTPADAIDIARRIKENQTINGTVQLWDNKKIATGDWSAVQFLSPYLVNTFNQIKQDSIFITRKLNQIAHVGPGGQRIDDAFTKSTVPDETGRVALWQHDTQVRKSMKADFDKYIIAKTTKQHLAERYWKQRSTLLLAKRISTPNVRVVAVRTETPLVGNAWIPCSITTELPQGVSVENLEKALCIYLNSSIGILDMLGHRSNKKLVYPNFSLDDLRNLDIPDFRNIKTQDINAMCNLWDQHAETELLPVKEMNNDPTRKRIDSLVAQILDIQPETIARIRNELTREPFITGKRYNL